MDRAEFERALRDKGRYYHIHHPFHVAMYEGRASREQIQGWVANRFYYQVNIPLKDAAILANCPDREVRREWIQRILDHDGARRGGRHRGLAASGGSGGPGARAGAVRGAGAARRALRRRRLRQLRPSRQLAGGGEQFADRTLRPADPPVAAGQLAAPLSVDRGGRLRVFRSRLAQARRDVEHGLRITLEHYRTREAQERMLDILQFKLDVLWSMLDAMSMAYELERPPYHTVTRERVWHRGLAS